MIDRRLERLAYILIHHSLRIKKNDLFAINGSHLAAPLIREVYKQALDAGAHPYTNIGIDGLSELYYKHSSEAQLKYVSPIDKFEIQRVNARLSIISPENTRNLTSVDPKKQAMSSQAHNEIMEIFLNRAAKKELRWCVTQYPTQASAQDAEMSLQDYEDFVFEAAHASAKDPLAYWKTVFKQQERIKKFLQTKKKLHVTAKDTDLTVNVTGRTWINCFGQENFPDGEVFTGPVENATEGCIRYTFPLSYGGREVEDVQFWFKEGKVVKATASKAEQFLKTMLATDPGATRLGEFSFGTNYGVKQYTKNMLFDEKIGGTIHIALGTSFPESGGLNESAIHWDILKDMKKGGEIYADGKLFYKNGKFVI